jgi:hypothetical protein
MLASLRQRLMALVAWKVEADRRVLSRIQAAK